MLRARRDTHRSPAEFVLREAVQSTRRLHRAPRLQMSSEVHFIVPQEVDQGAKPCLVHEKVRRPVLKHHSRPRGDTASQRRWRYGKRSTGNTSSTRMQPAGTCRGIEPSRMDVQNRRIVPARACGGRRRGSSRTTRCKVRRIGGILRGCRRGGRISDCDSESNSVLWFRRRFLDGVQP